MVTRDSLILMKQQDWQALERKRQQYTTALGNLRVLAEMLYDSEDKTRCLDKVAHYEQILEQIEREMFDLENWLIDHDAPGWVAT